METITTNTVWRGNIVLRFPVSPNSRNIQSKTTREFRRWRKLWNEVSIYKHIIYLHPRGNTKLYFSYFNDAGRKLKKP